MFSPIRIASLLALVVTYSVAAPATVDPKCHAICPDQDNSPANRPIAAQIEKVDQNWAVCDYYEVVGNTTAHYYAWYTFRGPVSLMQSDDGQGLIEFIATECGEADCAAGPGDLSQ